MGDQQLLGAETRLQDRDREDGGGALEAGLHPAQLQYLLEVSEGEADVAALYQQHLHGQPHLCNKIILRKCK